MRANYKCLNLTGFPTFDRAQAEFSGHLTCYLGLDHPAVLSGRAAVSVYMCRQPVRQSCRKARCSWSESGLAK